MLRSPAASFMFFALLLAAAAGCSSDSATGPDEELPGFAFESLADETVAEIPGGAGSYGNYDFSAQSSAFSEQQGSAQTLVIESSSTFSDFWRALYSNVSEVPARPEIDFSEEVVVAAVMDRQSTGGYDIAIEEITAQDDGTARVRVQSTTPAPGCQLTQAFTQPYHVVRVNRSASDFTFSFEETTGEECGN